MKIITKIFLLIVIAFLAVAFFIGLDLYFKKSPDYVSFDAKKSFTKTEDFIKEHNQYYGSVVQIIGTVTEIDYDENRIFLNDNFSFSFTDTSLNDFSAYVTKHDLIEIKARYIGYDDLFDEYSFDSSVFLHNLKE